MLVWIAIYVCGIIGLAWAYYCSQTVLNVNVVTNSQTESHNVKDENIKVKCGYTATHHNRRENC